MNLFVFLNRTYFVSIHRECIGKFGDVLGLEVWNAINTVFDVLPFSAVIDDKVNRTPFFHSRSIIS